MPGPLLSVVVIGRNESANLERCFRSIRTQDSAREPLELIYVDSGSSDDSREVAAAQHARVIALGDPPFTAARGREAGWRAAVGEWILFLDGDCVLVPGAVSATAELRADPAVAVVWGVSRELGSPNIPFFQRVLQLRYRGHPEGPGPLIGGNYFCRRKVLEAVDGFDTGLVGGENANLGWRIRKQGGVVHHLEVPLVEFRSGITGWKQYWRRGVRFGRDEGLHLTRARNFAARLFDSGSAERLKDLVSLAVFLLLALAVIVYRRGDGLFYAGVLFGVLLAVKVWRCRNKGPLGMVLLYAIHAQILCAPMIVGLLQYGAGRVFRTRSG